MGVGELFKRRVTILSDPEQSISQAQIEAARAQSERGEGLDRHHKWNIAALGERTLFFVAILVVMGLLVLWLSMPSPLVIFGSLLVIFVLLILWGVARIRRIERIRKQREMQAKGDLLR